QIPLRVGDTGAVHVRASPISPQASPGRQTARVVGTAPPEETMPCSASTPHSDIPTAYVVRWQHSPSTCGLTGTSQYLVRPIRARLAPALPWPVPNAPRATQLLAL